MPLVICTHQEIQVSKKKNFVNHVLLLIKQNCYRNLCDVRSCYPSRKIEQITCYQFSKFKIWLTSHNNTVCSGHPPMKKQDKKVAWAKEAVHKNRIITICKFSNDEAAAFRSYQNVLTQNEHIRSWQICALYVDWKAKAVQQSIWDIFWKNIKKPPNSFQSHHRWRP